MLQCPSPFSHTAAPVPLEQRQSASSEHAPILLESRKKPSDEMKRVNLRSIKKKGVRRTRTTYATYELLISTLITRLHKLSVSSS